MSPNHHSYFNSLYNLQPWAVEQQLLEYPQYSHQPQPLAYRLRVDSYGFTPPHGRMASPAPGMEPAPQPTAPTEYPDDPSFEGPDGRLEMGQDEIDAIIRNKRKVRDPKACYACHRRKVKCNRELPCDSCVKRDHPELCSYERPTKRRRIALATQTPQQDGDEIKSPAVQSGPNITVPREQWERVNIELQQLRDQLSDAHAGPAHDQAEAEYQNGNNGSMIGNGNDAEREGIYAPSNQMGTMHLGSRSVLAYMMGLGRSKSTQDAARSLLEENILPKLGLDNESVTYPFVDLWSTDNSIKDINGLCSAIPDDNLCREFFYAYRDVACTIYPVVPEPPQFEATMNFMLANRAKAQAESLQLDPSNPLGISLSWLALVFAVFASGAQCTGLPAKERELTSQVYTCCSYQALRMSNFMTHPNLETVEASLIIGNVLAYNMNPGVAYIFLGMVIRMAFSIGLQMNTAGFSDHENWLRRRVWWALAWQDSHFSISYDRPSASVLCHPDIPYTYGSAPGNRSYAETMYSIIVLTQELIRDRSFGSRSQYNWTTIQKYKETVNTIVNDGVPHLRERTLCLKITQHLERLALKLHSSYITSELCRPALKDNVYDLERSTSHPAQSPPIPGQGRRRKLSASGSSSSATAHSPSSEAHSIIAALRRDCVRSLEGAVEAYVELHSLSEFAARSWIGIQRAISAAFMLGTLPETNQEPRILNLLRDLERCIAQRTMDDPTFEKLRNADNHTIHSEATNEGVPLTEAPHWARSMTRSLNALGKLNATLNSHKAAKTYGGGSQYPTPQGSFGNLQSHAMPPLRGPALPPMQIYPNQNQHQNQNQALTQSQNPHLNQHQILKHEQGQYSPTLGLMNANVNGEGQGMMGTPTSASSGSGGEWSYEKLKERGAEWIQPALWR